MAFWTQLRVLTVFWLVANYFVTCGVIYGWAGLQRQLVAEGQFSDLCPNSRSPCTAQDTALNTIVTVAFNIANAATVVHGFTLDRYGVRANAVVGGLIFTFGMLLLSISSSSSFNAFILAYTMLGWGGIAVYLASFQFANLYARPNMWRAIVNAMFTAAGLTFTIADWLYQAGVQRDVVLGLYACISAALTVGMLLVFPTHAYQPGDDCSMPVVEWWTGYTPVRKAKSEAAAVDDDRKDTVRDDEPAEHSTAEAKVEGALLLDDTTAGSSDGSAQLPAAANGVPTRREDDNRAHATLWQEIKDPRQHYSSLPRPIAPAEPPHAVLKCSLCVSVIVCTETILLGLLFGFGLLFSNWFNATIGNQLTAMGDKGDYAIAFIFVSSLLPIPISVAVSHWLRTVHYSGTVAICCVCVCLSYFPLYVDSLPLQLIAFPLYTTGRALVVTIMFTYAATQYRADHYGRVVALVVVIATPIGFLQLLMQQQSDRFGYKAINTLCAIAFTPALLHALWLRNRNI